MGSCVVVSIVMEKEREREGRRPVLSRRKYCQTTGGLFIGDRSEMHVIPSAFLWTSPNKHTQVESLWMEMTRITDFLLLTSL